MALTVKLTVASAEGEIYTGLVQQVVLPGTTGELGVLPRHAPLLTRLKPGAVRAVTADGGRADILVAGGFAEVQPDLVTVLADTALRTDRLDALAAEAARHQARIAKRRRLTAEDYARIARDLQLDLALLRALEAYRRRSTP